MTDELPRREVADNFARRFAPPELYDPKKRREWKLGRHDGDRGPYVIELNLQHIEGLPGAVAALDMRLRDLNGDAAPPPPAEYISKTYARVLLTVEEWQRLLRVDGEEADERVAEVVKEDEKAAAARAEEARAKGATEAVAVAGARRRGPPPDPCVTAPSTSCGRTFLSTARSTAQWRRSNRMLRSDRSARAVRGSCGR